MEETSLPIPSSRDAWGGTPALSFTMKDSKAPGTAIAKTTIADLFFRGRV